MYVKVSDVFADHELDTSDPENPVLVIDGYELPTNKDLLITPQGEEINLDGLTVYFNVEDHESLTISGQAVRFIKMGTIDRTPRGKAAGVGRRVETMHPSR